MYPLGNELHCGGNATSNATTTCLSEESCNVLDIVPDHFTPLLVAELGAGVTFLALAPLALDGKVIKCQYSSKRAQIYIRSQLFPSTFN
jgi:hypothetical protein